MAGKRHNVNVITLILLCYEVEGKKNSRRRERDETAGKMTILRGRMKWRGKKDELEGKKSDYSFLV